TDNAHDSLGDNDNNGVQKNAETIANGYTLPPKRRNTKSSTRKCSNNTNNINIESATADQSNADETNNAHDSLDDNNNN
ncbi:41116_t:CDS:2, partial [Gigaspora margarita]